jgi:hypothetical protein
VLVRALSEISHCEGGCNGCDLFTYCSDPGLCEEGCNWTPIPLYHFPQRAKRATGVWVRASSHTGPAHCKLQLAFHRNSSSPSWAGKGAVVAAVVYDRRTGDRLPLVVGASYSEVDPAVLNGGCPNCPD